MTSSASTPSTTSTGQPSAATASCSGSTCERQVVGHRACGSPCTRVLGVAEGLALGVEHARAGRRLIIGGELAQHVEHAVDRPRRLAGLRAPQLRQRVERAIEVRRAVDQQQRFRRIISRHDESEDNRSWPELAKEISRARSVAGVRHYGRVRRGDRAPGRHPSRGLGVRQRARQAGHALLRSSPRTPRACSPTPASPWSAAAARA